MRFIICLLLPLCGVLGTLQMDKDLQYKCYYQILKKYTTKTYYDYDDDIEYNRHLADTSTQNNSYAASSTESQQERMRRDIFKDHDDTSSIQDMHTNDLDKTFSSAYAEPRNSGHYKQAFKPARSSLNRNSTNFTVDETNIFNTKEVTYFIVASRTLRAGFVYKVSISVLQAKHPIKAFANISCDGVNLSGDSIDVYTDGSETLKLHLGPNTLSKRACKLRLEGFFLNQFCDLAFLYEHPLEYAQYTRMILIQTDKPLYMQGDTLRFRVTVMSADLQPSECIVEIFLIDPHEHITWHWLTPLSSSGTIALQYTLADRPIFGEWTISVAIAVQGGQQKRTHFTVEEYYSTRCEVEVNMPAVFFTTSAFIKGTVTATTTNSDSESINGNLTLIATFYPLGYLDGRSLNKQYRLGLFNNIPNKDISPELFKHPKELLNRTAYILHKNKKSARHNNDFLPHGRRLFQQTVTQFNESYKFKWSKFELEDLQANMTAVEILVTATVAADNTDAPCSGYAISHIYKPTMRISFLGGSPQIFKPTLPFTVFVAVEYINGSPLDSSLLTEGQMEVRGVISTKSATKLSWPNRRLQMLHHRAGIWELKIDLRNDMPHLRDLLNSVIQLRLQATFTAERQAGTKRAHNTTTSAELQLVAHFSPRHQYIKVATSTEQPTVGEYIIFEINTNFFVEYFHYMVIAKSVILVSEREFLTDGMRTIALVLSAEMSPFAEIFVWAVTWQGQIVADSLTFPVAGMFRNNFTVTIENGYENEHPVSILGEAGTYVSLTAIARDIYNMQPDGFALTYTAFLTEMQLVYNNTSKLYKHGWYMHKDHNSAYVKHDNVYYPASTFGIDANSTFAQSGLIVSTDGVVPHTAHQCKEIGFEQCLMGSCYLLAKKCDGYRDCIDGSDEVGCEQLHQPTNDLSDNQNYRINRISRHYQNAVWLWKDVQIDSSGHSKFYVNEPADIVTSQWILNGYSTRLSKGLGVISKTLAYISQKPIAVKIDMPGHCRQYEHVGIRVNIFKNSNTTITANMTLRKSTDYVLVTDKLAAQFSVKFAAHERQRTVLMSIMPYTLGKIAVVLFVETTSGVINITSHLNVASADLNPQQQRVWYTSILLNLTKQQSHIVEHLNIPKLPYNHVHISLVTNAVSAFIGKHTYSSSYLETAEECALALATNLYSLMYLRPNMNKHNATAEKHIYFHMNQNYQRLLSFMRPDGSFSNLLAADWNHLDSSVWLTAHCLQLIQQAAAYKMIDYIWIDVTIIEANLNWLLQQQTLEGSWLQTGNSAEDNKNKIILTAHVLITLCSLQNLSHAYELRVEKAKSNAIDWIEQNGHSHLNTAQHYEVVLTTYALLLCKSTVVENTLPILRGLARHSKESYLYWSSSDLEKNRSHSRLRNECNSLDIETTAYALLTYLIRSEPQTEAIVNWLNTNCLYDYGWISARATSITMYALLKFYAHSGRRENIGIVVELLASSTQRREIKEYLYLNNSNAAQLQNIELNDVDALKINAKGFGSGVLHVHFDTDADKVSQSSATPAFRINNKASFHGRQGSHITYTIYIKWINDTQQQAINKGVTILDVMLPTGYGIEQQLLDAYVRSNNVKHLLRAKYMETNIIFYFIDLAEEDTCVQFTIKRWYPVANITRFWPIRIYNYNAPEHFASTMFDALPIYRLNISQIFASSSCTNCLTSSSSSSYLKAIKVKLMFLFLLLLFCLYSLQMKSKSCLNI